MKKNEPGAPLRTRRKRGGEPAREPPSTPLAGEAPSIPAAEAKPEATAAVTARPALMSAAPKATELAAAGGGPPGDPLDDFFVTDAERQRMVASYAGDGPRTATVARQKMLELLAFWVADEEYALPIVDIQELIKVPPVTELPRAHEAVLGVISLRGTIVPILDLRRVLQLEERPMTRQTRILVVRPEDEPVGLLVDRVTSVVRFEADKIESTPRAMQHQASELLRGVGRVQNRLIIVLDVGAVVNVMDAAA